MNTPQILTRRTFIKNAAITGAVVSAMPLFNIRAQSKTGGRKFKIGLVGCGGRGTGAVDNILEAAKTMGHTIEVVAVADFFQDKADKVAAKFPGCRAYAGADAYHKVVAEKEIEIILLATPPIFRPLHFAAAVAAGKHCFIEKPVAVDPVGARKVIAIGEVAKQKGLTIVAGTQRRHMADYQHNQNAIAQGAIGKITGGNISWCGGTLWFKERAPGESDASYLVRNWTSFAEMSGDHIVEQHVHQLDVTNWFLGRPPVSAIGFGGRARRKTGNQFDFFSVDFNYGDDCHIHSMCRQVKGCYDNVGEFYIGTEGTTYGGGNKMKSANLDKLNIPEFKTHANGQVQEHVDMLAAIAADKPINGAKDVAESTMTAIMGRIACYTGQQVRWSDLMTNAESQWFNLTLKPASADFEGGTVVAPKDEVCPIPGAA